MNDVNLIDLKKNIKINLINKNNMFYSSLQSLYEYVGRYIIAEHKDFNSAYQLTENVIVFYKLDKKLLDQFETVNKFSNLIKHRNPGQTGPKFDQSMANCMVSSYNDYIIELTKKGAIQNEFLLMLETSENSAIISDSELKSTVKSFEESEAYKEIVAKVDLLSEKIKLKDIESRNSEIRGNLKIEENSKVEINDFDNADESKAIPINVDLLSGKPNSSFEDIAPAKEKISSIFMNRKYLFPASIAILIIFAIGIFIFAREINIPSNLDASQNKELTSTAITTDTGKIEINPESGSIIVAAVNNSSLQVNKTADDMVNQTTIKNYSDGSIYKGLIVNDLRNGVGIMTWPNGDYYSGEWKNDKQNGQGKMVTSEYEYSGDFAFGKKEGYGKIQYINGDIYEGYWENDKMHGKGDAIYADGTKYVGDFKYGLYDGFGTYYGEIKEGTFMVDGEFSNNATVVDGLMMFNNGNGYKGRFENYVLQGFGSYILSNGIVFSGNFIDFLLDGKATITLLDGLVVNATFEKGDLISDYTTVMQNGEIKKVVLTDGKGTIIN